jgi:hypothetical protein
MNKFPCPACGAEISLAQVEQAGDLLALARAQAAFGEDWALVREYLGLFGSKREMKVAKLLRLAREVWQIWDTGKFCVGGAWYLIGREEFREALRATCNQAHPTLTNHNYLKKVLIAAARQTSQRRERELKSREQGLGVRERESPPSPQPSPPGGEGEDTVEWRQRYLELLKRSKDMNLTPAERAAAEAALKAHLEAKEDG